VSVYRALLSECVHGSFESEYMRLICVSVYRALLSECIQF